MALQLYVLYYSMEKNDNFLFQHKFMFFSTIGKVYLTFKHCPGVYWCFIVKYVIQQLVKNELIFLHTYYAVRQKYPNQIWFEGGLGILSWGHLTYHPLIWLKVTSLSSTASVLREGKISPKTHYFIDFLSLFLLEAVEARDVTFNQIKWSYIKFPLLKVPKPPSNQI